VQGAADRPADRLIRPGLDLPSPPQALDRHRPERIQQHSLAYAAQPGQDHAAFWPATGNALEHDLELSELPVPPGKLRGALAGSRRVRISHWIHGIAAYGAI
jgi:hypothetical protein